MSIPEKSFDPDGACPLDGVRVIDLSRLVAGNAVSSQLAEASFEPSGEYARARTQSRWARVTAERRAEHRDWKCCRAAKPHGLKVASRCWRPRPPLAGLFGADRSCTGGRGRFGCQCATRTW